MWGQRAERIATTSLSLLLGDELPTIGGGVGAREQHSSHPNLPDIGNESDSEHAITYCIVINMLRDGARKQKKKVLHCWRFFYRAKKKKARKINKVSLLEQRVCPL